MLALGLLAVRPVFAQSTSPDDPRKAQANAVFDEGIQLHNKNLEAEALAKYEQSYAIYPSPNTLYNMAFQEKLLGNHLQAIRHFREALRNPLIAPRAAELGKKFISELEPSFARIEVSGPNRLVVSLGGEQVTLPLPEPLDVEPGKISAAGVMDGRRYEGSATVAAGQVATIELRAPEAQRRERRETAERKEGNYWTSQHITGVALGGAAVVAAGLGLGFLAARENHVSDAKSIASDPTACGVQTSVACQKYLDAKDGKRNATTGEVISFVAAGALAVGAVVLLVPWQKKEGARVSARLLPTGQGVLLDGAF